MVKVDKSRILAFETASDLSKWLKKNHDKETELWLKIYKKKSGLKSITWNEVVVEILCWGWIDGVKKSLDDQAYLQRITPRKKGSNWSKRNREHVEVLNAEKRMKESGMVHVRAAQEDGRWEAAYPPSSEMEVPSDLIVVLEKNKKAKRFYDTLDKTNLYAIAYRLCTAKKPETRKRRFNKIIAMLENNEKFH